ncbi:MAG: ABC transporter substrate-binding protein [Thermoleophilia bacterium]|jgi:NitT/TauT family transport system substrate-binding protein
MAHRIKKSGAVTRSLWVAALLVTLGAGLLWAAACDSEADDGGTVSSGPTATEGTTSTSSPGPKLEKLTLVAPPGPMAIPMAYMAVNDSLASVAENTQVVIWQNADQLRAMVAGEQGDFVTMPSNNSAIFYNKGLVLKALDISVWNITYLVTNDPKAASFADIKGRSLVVSLKGSVPDVMFQYLVKKEGLDPAKDFQLRYVPDPTQAAQLLLSGQADNAILSEALATSVILQSKDSGKPFRRALAFDKAWAAAIGGAGSAASTPIAGTVATAAVLDKPEVIAVFEEQYQKAVEWMLANPDEAGKLVETELPQLGLKAAPMTASLKNIRWEFTPALEARTDLEAFYRALSELSPEVIGGRLPDNGFYYAP